MRTSKRPCVTFRLHGAAGNQLFIIAAGLELQQRELAQVVFDATHIGEQSSFATSLQLPHILLKDRRTLLDAARDAVGVRLPAASTAVRSGHTRNSPGFERMNGKDFPHHSRVLGLFQSWRHALRGLPSLRDGGLKLARPSTWLSDIEESAERTSPIAVHVRGGDYASGGNKWGVLSPKYYVAAVKQTFRVLGNTAPLWIFSDDRNRSEQVAVQLSGIASVELRSCPPSLDPVSDMVAMSRAAALVTANSTFSWWAAFGLRRGSPVILPSPWLQTDGNRVDPYLPGWHTCPAVWDEP